MAPIQSAWMDNSDNQRILVCKRNFVVYSFGNRKIFIWFTLSTTKEIFIFNYLSTLIREFQSWIIKIGAGYIIQVSLVLSERKLHDRQKKSLFCDEKPLALETGS